MHTNALHTPDGAPPRRRRRSRRRRSQEPDPSDPRVDEHSLPGGQRPGAATAPELSRSWRAASSAAASRAAASRPAKAAEAAAPAYTEDADCLGPENLDLSMSRPAAAARPEASVEPRASAVVTGEWSGQQANAPAKGGGGLFRGLGRNRRGSQRMPMQQVDLSAKSEREEHSIGELSGRHTMSLKDFSRVSNASNAHKTSSYSYVEVERSTERLSIDVSGCTDMHGYGMRTILYPYDPNRSTNRGRRARDTVIVSICYCMSAYCRRCIRLQ